MQVATSLSCHPRRGSHSAEGAARSSGEAGPTFLGRARVAGGSTMSKRTMVQLTKVRFFGLVFRSTGLAEIVTDLNGLITHANPAAERLHGWGPGELVGHSV